MAQQSRVSYYVESSARSSTIGENNMIKELLAKLKCGRDRQTVRGSP